MLAGERFVRGFDTVKTSFSTPLREQTPPDFKKEILFGKRPILGEILMVPGEWIAKVHYGLFNYPVKIEMYPHIPKDAAEVVLRLLKKEIL